MIRLMSHFLLSSITLSMSSALKQLCFSILHIICEGRNDRSITSFRMAIASWIEQHRISVSARMMLLPE